MWLSIGGIIAPFVANSTRAAVIGFVLCVTLGWSAGLIGWQGARREQVRAGSDLGNQFDTMLVASPIKSMALVAFGVVASTIASFITAPTILRSQHSMIEAGVYIGLVQLVLLLLGTYLTRKQLSKFGWHFW